MLAAGIVESTERDVLDIAASRDLQDVASLRRGDGGIDGCQRCRRRSTAAGGCSGAHADYRPHRRLDACAAENLAIVVAIRSGADGAQDGRRFYTSHDAWRRTDEDGEQCGQGDATVHVSFSGFDRGAMRNHTCLTPSAAQAACQPAAGFLEDCAIADPSGHPLAPLLFRTKNRAHY